MACYSVGNIVATFYGGVGIEKFSLKQVLWAGLVICSISLVTISYINSYYLLAGVMIILGIGMGILNVSGNSLASIVFTKNKGKMMNIFHLFFGVGGIIAPIYANHLFDLGFSWEGTYSIGSVLIVFLFLFSLLCKVPEKKGEAKKKETTIIQILKDREVVIFTLMFLMHVGAEIGVGSWLGVYLVDVQARTDTEVGFYISLFYILFTIGRFIASLIVERVGYLRLVIICAVGGIITILLGLIGPSSFAILLSITGLFISVNFPTMQAAMFENFSDNISAIIGLTLTAGGLGNIIFANWLVGIINDLVGIRLGYGIFILYLIILAGLTYSLKAKYIKKEGLITAKSNSKG
jgi:fucose permease